MLTVTSTNFGTAPADIQLKDFQTMDLVVLEGEVEVNPGSAAYLAAEDLEIKVADLKISSSAPTAVYVLNPDASIPEITVTKAWIADKNTIKIKKLSDWNDLDSYTLAFQCLFFVKGRKFVPNRGGTTSVYPPSAPTGINQYSNYCVKHPSWMYFCLLYSSFKTGTPGQAISIPYNGISGITADLFLVYNPNEPSMRGSGYIRVHVENGNLEIPEGLSAVADNDSGWKFIKGFIVL
jgi:hypothetical protein